MTPPSHTTHQIQYATNFQDLISTPFYAEINATCWTRQLSGDFAEIVHKVKLNENITVLEQETLLALELSAEGQLARQVLLNDLELLTAHGASLTSPRFQRGFPHHRVCNATITLARKIIPYHSCNL